MNRKSLSLRPRGALAVLAAAVAFGVVGPAPAQDTDSSAVDSLSGMVDRILYDDDAPPPPPSAGSGAGMAKRIDTGPTSAGDAPSGPEAWEQGVAGGDWAAQRMSMEDRIRHATRIPGDPVVAGARTSPGGVAEGTEVLLDLGDAHLDFRDARYRYGISARYMRDSNLDSIAPGIWFQGPDWYRRVNVYGDPDPKLTGAWRFSFSQHDLEPKNGGVSGNDSVLVGTAGIGWDYFFRRQMTPDRDVNGQLQYDQYGDVVMRRQNSAFLSAYMERYFFFNTKGNTLGSTVGDDANFVEDRFALTIGGGYQVKDKFRIGLEHSVMGSPMSSTQLNLGLSF